MPKQIILYNLQDGVKEEDYIKWCEDYKGPVMLGVKSAKRFTLLRVLGGERGDGQKGIEPAQAKFPYRYIGIMDVEGLEEWRTNTAASKEFSEEFAAEWFTKWAADFYALDADEIYDRANK